VITAGFPFARGIGSLEDDGALEPTSGAGETVREVGDIQELSSCWKVILSFWVIGETYYCVRMKWWLFKRGCDMMCCGDASRPV
jgi:hypothetical protein